MLPAGPLHGADHHLQGLPVLAPPGLGNDREEGGPHRHAGGEPQGEERFPFTFPTSFNTRYETNESRLMKCFSGAFSVFQV